MTACFTVELHTQAPLLNAELGQWDPFTRLLTIPISVDEPAAISAYYVPFATPYVSYPVFASAESLTASLPADVDGGNGRVHVTLTDDLLNSSAYALTIGRDASPVSVRTRTFSLSAYRGSGQPRLRLSGFTPGDPPVIKGPRGR